MSAHMRHPSTHGGPAHHSLTAYHTLPFVHNCAHDPHHPQAVVFLDVVAARVRYGLHLGATLPRFVPWSAVFHRRGGQQVRKRLRSTTAEAGGTAGGAEAEAAEAGNEEEEEEEAGYEDDEDGAEDGAGDAGDEDGWRYAVRLRGLRHPLLLGDYKKERARLEREIRRKGGDPAALEARARAAAAAAAAAAAGTDADVAAAAAEQQQRGAGRGGAARSGGLSSARASMLQEAGLESAPALGAGGAGGKAREGEMEELVVSHMRSLFFQY